jgi:type I restriction enzyme, S subunit
MTSKSLPSGWTWKILSDVAAPIPNAIVDGPFGSNLKVDDYRDSGVPVLQGKNVTNDTFRWFDIRYISDLKAAQLKRSSVRVGDILMVKIGSIGYSAYVDNLSGSEFAIIPANLAKMTPNLKLIDIRYLLHWLKSHASKRYLMEVASKTAQPALSLSKIKQLPIPTPAISEQRRIAAILDQAEALRTKRRQALAKLDTLTQSLFLEMFGEPTANPKGWPRISLFDLLTVIESGTSPVCLDRAAREDEWGVLKLGSVTKCSFDDSANKALPSAIKPNPKLEVKPGDLLFSRKNTHDLVGAVAVVRKTRAKLLLPDLIFRLVPKPDARVNKIYLHALLTSPRKRRRVQSLAGGSAGSMPNISKARLLQVSIELPPLEVQDRFSKIVTEAQCQFERSANESVLIDQLFASLQHRAFNGEL